MNDTKKKRLTIIVMSSAAAIIGILSVAGNDFEVTFARIIMIAAFVVSIVLFMLFTKRSEENSLELRQDIDFYDEDENLELEDDNRNYKQSDLV